MLSPMMRGTLREFGGSDVPDEDEDSVRVDCWRPISANITERFLLATFVEMTCWEETLYLVQKGGEYGCCVCW